MEWLPENFHAHCGLENSGRLVIDANFNVVSWKQRDSTIVWSTCDTFTH